MATLLEEGKKIAEDAERAISDVIKTGKRDVEKTMKKGKRTIITRKR